VITISGLAVHDAGTGVHDQRNTHIHVPVMDRATTVPLAVEEAPLADLIVS
jgi:hypothetical protein